MCCLEGSFGGSRTPPQEDQRPHHLQDMFLRTVNQRRQVCRTAENLVTSTQELLPSRSKPALASSLHPLRSQGAVPLTLLLNAPSPLGYFGHSVFSVQKGKKNAELGIVSSCRGQHCFGSSSWSEMNTFIRYLYFWGCV